jgi:hypothetical protein
MKATAEPNRTTPRWRQAVAGALLAAAALPQAVVAGEGGTTHVIPGATATLADNAPTAPTTFVKPMYLNYDGSATAQIPTAAGLAGNLRARANTVALVAGHAFETKVLGATYTVAAALPYSFLDVSGDVQTRGGNTVRSIQNSVSGFGDLTVIPAMLAWKEGDWQLNALLPIFAPTGSYKAGRLGNPGLNYWTFVRRWARCTATQGTVSTRSLTPATPSTPRTRTPTTAAAACCTSTARCSRSSRRDPASRPSGWKASGSSR